MVILLNILDTELSGEFRLVEQIIIRTLGSEEPGQCTIIEDEGDRISEDPDKVNILKSGYEHDSRIPKINMNTSDQLPKWFFPFCYKMIFAEKSLKEYKVPGLVDRTFSNQLQTW